MTARLILGLVLVVLQTALLATGTSHSALLIAISAAYFAGTLAARLYIKPRPLGESFNRAWVALVGLDVVAFSALQLLQGNSINYTLDVMGNRVNETVTDTGGNLTRQVSRVYDILNRLQTVTGAAQ